MKKTSRSRISRSEAVKRYGLRLSREVVKLLAADELSQAVSGCPAASDTQTQTNAPASATNCTD